MINWDDDLFGIPDLPKEKEESTQEEFKNLEAVVQNPRFCYICGYQMENSQHLKDTYSKGNSGNIAIRLHLYCYKVKIENNILEKY